MNYITDDGFNPDNKSVIANELGLLTFSRMVQLGIPNTFTE
jgi:hypothetical protein